MADVENMNDAPVQDDLKQYDLKTFLFSFKGRVNRQKYILGFFIPSFFVQGIASFLDRLTGTDDLIAEVFMWLMLWPAAATTAKRFHDQDFSGWWQLAFILGPVFAYASMFLAGALGMLSLPLVIFGYGIMLWFTAQILFIKGTKGPNRFGADPLRDKF